MTGYFEAGDNRPGVDTDTLDPHEQPEDVPRLSLEHAGPLEAYFERLTREAYRCYAVAKQARARGVDPVSEPEIPFAEDLASRVEALVGPEGIAKRIRDLSETMEREELALTVSKEVANERFTTYDGPEEALDAAIRAGLAILTEGILVAPLEGVAEVKVRTNEDGSRYADVYFAGPIRAAGGTGQALSVLIADVVRREVGLDEYQATSNEVERFKEEIPAYKKAANLQYTPSAKEIELIVSNLPVGVNGEGTETDEVSGQRDLPRVETNQLRGGACLVIAEGMTLKASKLEKHVTALGLEGWGFLDDYQALTKDDEDDEGADEADDRIKPIKKFIKELTAGRPVLSHPMAKGGFRLRYGRARTAGLAATSIHPALCGLVDDFLAIGTQMKTERPGKGTLVAPCDTIEPPLVRLDDGTVREVETYDEALEIRDRVDTIVDLGEILVPYGEFLENNKPLPPASWCPEWWERLIESTGTTPPQVPDDAARAAFRFAQRTDTPLHPRFTLFWTDTDAEDVHALARAAHDGSWQDERLHLDNDEGTRTRLETLGATFHTHDGEIVLDERCSLPIARATGHRVKKATLTVETDPATIDTDDVLELVTRLSGVTIKDKAPCRIGARMGRPEKAAAREMSPPVHGLFPIGGAGGLQRLIRDASQKGTIGTDQARDYNAIETGARECSECGLEETLFLDCPDCGARTHPVEGAPSARKIPLKDLVRDALDRLGEKKIDPNTKGVQGLISETKLPEPLEKGILRAKREIYTFKDGTCRYDMTDLALTHFRPGEIGTSVEKLNEMGYTHAADGSTLEDEDQLVPLKPQDVVINEDALEYMARVARFVDDELTRLYDIEPFYDLDDDRDLIGHLAVGLAPHTSGGVLCRIIGTTKAAGHWCHPYFHAAKRRNCFTGDTEILVFQDGQTEKVRLDDLVDDVIDERGRPIDAHGTKAAAPDEELYVLSIHPETKEPVRHPITKLIRGKTDTWVDIATTSNRSFRVTPGHQVLVKRAGKFTTVRADDIEVGDEVPVGTSLPRDETVPTFNLAKEFSRANVNEDIRIRGAKEWLLDLFETHGVEDIDDLIGPRTSGSLGDWCESFPLQDLSTLVSEGITDWKEVPDHARIGLARDHVALPVRIPADTSLCRLMGLYLSEGHARSEKAAHQLSWRTSEEELSRQIQHLVFDVFGRKTSVSEGGGKITLCSKLAYLLVVHVWKLGERAEDKRVPGWCFQLPEQELRELLGGYFDGDGTVVMGQPAIRLYSKNTRLLQDIGTVLQAVGIFSRFSKGKRREPGKFLKSRYQKLGTPPPETLDPVHALVLTGCDVKYFAGTIQSCHPEKRERLQLLSIHEDTGRFLHGGGSRGPADQEGHYLFDRIKEISEVETANEDTYCIDIETSSNELKSKNVLLGNGLYQIRCDGDEDPIMLLLDGLINFSRWYLPDRRGGQMDAPLTLSLHVNPEEIDSEAHNVDCSQGYPLEFYEATETIPGPKEALEHVEIVEGRLGTPAQYDQLPCTHDTSRLDDGPRLSAYKTIDSMMEKMEGQLSLGDKIRAVDAGDVASRVICDHFLPDIQGNLNAFTRQTMRCAKCNAKYRRVPLDGRCRKCRNELTMTVHEASVKKYVTVAREVAENYEVDAYTQQRLELIDDQLESLFTNDKVEKAKLSDFL